MAYDLRLLEDDFDHSGNRAVSIDYSNYPHLFNRSSFGRIRAENELNVSFDIASFFSGTCNHNLPSFPPPFPPLSDKGFLAGSPPPFFPSPDISQLAHNPYQTQHI